MKKIEMFICIILLLVTSGCGKKSNTNVKENELKQEETKETKENEQILEINKKLDGVFIEKHTGTQLIDDEINDIKLILSGIIYCYEHYQDPNIINNEDEIDKTQELLAGSTLGAILKKAGERLDNKITDEDSARSIIKAAASVYAKMAVCVWYKADKTELEETLHNMYMEGLETTWISLNKCFNIEYDSELQKYFEVIK